MSSLRVLFFPGDAVFLTQSIPACARGRYAAFSPYILNLPLSSFAYDYSEMKGPKLHGSKLSAISFLRAPHVKYRGTALQGTGSRRDQTWKQ